MAVQVTDTNSYVNISINFHRTRCLRKEKFDVFADDVALCEWTLSQISMILLTVSPMFPDFFKNEFARIVDNGSVRHSNTIAKNSKFRMK